MGHTGTPEQIKSNQTANHTREQMALTYEAHYERLMNMPPNQFFDHFKCMQANIKYNTISQEHVQAMRDACPHQQERADEPLPN